VNPGGPGAAPRSRGAGLRPIDLSEPVRPGATAQRRRRRTALTYPKASPIFAQFFSTSTRGASVKGSSSDEDRHVPGAAMFPLGGALSEDGTGVVRRGG
jgi:hypothetical protein